MNYSEFLFVNLLREFNSNYNELPYDEMFSEYSNLFIDYENSKFNVDNKTEYQCMCDFFNSICVSDMVF